MRYADPSGHRLDVDGPRGPGTTSPGNIRDSYKPAPSRPAPSGGAQVIGGIAAAATGAGAAVRVPMILKGAAKIAVGALVLAAVVQGEETKESIPQAPIEDSKDYLILLKALITGTVIQTMSAQ